MTTTAHHILCAVVGGWLLVSIFMARLRVGKALEAVADTWRRRIRKGGPLAGGDASSKIAELDRNLDSEPSLLWLRYALGIAPVIGVLLTMARLVIEAPAMQQQFGPIQRARGIYLGVAIGAALAALAGRFLYSALMVKRRVREKAIEELPSIEEDPVKNVLGGIVQRLELVEQGMEHFCVVIEGVAQRLSNAPERIEDGVVRIDRSMRTGGELIEGGVAVLAGPVSELATLLPVLSRSIAELIQVLEQARAIRVARPGLFGRLFLRSERNGR